MKGCSPFSRNSSNLHSAENELHNESMNGSDHILNNNFSDNKGCSPIGIRSPIGNGCSPIEMVALQLEMVALQLKERC